MKGLLKRRQKRILDKIGQDNQVCLLDSHTILNALKDYKVIIMACNIRIKHPVPGIMRAAEELDAIVCFELARSEGNMEGGYTGQTPEIFFNTIIEYAQENRFSKPFFIHGDHIAVRDTSKEEFGIAKGIIMGGLKAGYTSFAIDASHNELPDNVRITAELARPIIEMGCGLEVEVGEIKAAGQEAEITTVEEALEFISELSKLRIHPDLLAINNGSKHGNYLPGEEVHIDLKRTGEVYEAIRPFSVSIAQHGITGTPLPLIGQFADYGIRKGNVGTQWQNIAHEGLPKDLMDRMKKWCEENKKDIKMATKPFKEEIDNIDKPYRDKIADLAYEEAKRLLKAFRAEGTASLLSERIK